MINLVGFSMQLQAIREQRGMTQEQLAAKTGLSAHYIGNLEQGVRTPSSVSLIKLCHALGTTPDFLLKDSISPEMLKGLSVDISDATTLREALDVFDALLSDHLAPTDDDPCFSPDDNLVHIHAADVSAPSVTLSDLLLRMSPENPDSI